MKIAAAQIACTLGNLDANLGKIRDFCEQAKKAGNEMIVFPEMVDTGYSMPTIQKHATSWNEGAVPELQRMAKDFAISIVCGVSDREGGKIYNGQVVVDAQGQVVGKYRKTHLVTAAPLDERQALTAGDAFASCKVNQFNLGLTICYDLRFPEPCRILTIKHGANVLVNSSAWPFPRVEHLRTLALARAIENQCYLVLANRVGTDDGVTFCGNSAIIDPYGVLLAGASADREEMVQADLSKKILDSVRNRMRVFEHRRTDLYR